MLSVLSNSKKLGEEAKLFELMKIVPLLGPFSSAFSSIESQLHEVEERVSSLERARGFTQGDENALRRAFGQFGRIMEVRYFKDKGYAFVRYDNKESACNAIVALHLTEVGGQVVKCSWGKEGGGSQPSQDSHYGGGGGGGYNSNQGSSRYHQQQQHYGGPPPTSGGHHGGPPQPPPGGDPSQQQQYQQYYAYMQQQQQQQQQAMYNNPQYAMQMQQYYASMGQQYPGGPAPPPPMYQGPPGEEQSAE